jgi:hypothetical protein
LQQGNRFNRWFRRPTATPWTLRINAEKPTTGADGKLAFAPSPARLQSSASRGTGISLIRAVDEGKTVTPYYDGMVVQLIAHAEDRQKTIRMLRQYLDRVEIRESPPIFRSETNSGRRSLQQRNLRHHLSEGIHRALDIVSLPAKWKKPPAWTRSVLDMDAMRITGRTSCGCRRLRPACFTERHLPASRNSYGPAMSSMSIARSAWWKR